MFNLKSLDKEGQANRGAWLHIINPETGKPAYLDEEKTKPVRIKLLGTNSDEWRLAQLEEINKARHESKRLDGKEDLELTPEYLANSVQSAAKKYARITVDWENMPKVDGSKGLQEFSKKAAERLYLDFMGARLQVDEFIAGEENFINS